MVGSLVDVNRLKDAGVFAGKACNQLVIVVVVDLNRAVIRLHGVIGGSGCLEQCSQIQKLFSGIDLILGRSCRKGFRRFSGSRGRCCRRSFGLRLSRRLGRNFSRGRCFGRGNSRDFRKSVNRRFYFFQFVFAGHYGRFFSRGLCRFFRLFGGGFGQLFYLGFSGGFGRSCCRRLCGCFGGSLCLSFGRSSRKRFSRSLCRHFGFIDFLSRFFGSFRFRHNFISRSGFAVKTIRTCRLRRDAQDHDRSHEQG